MDDVDWLQAKPLRQGEIWERRGSDDVAVYNSGTGVLAVLNSTALAIWELCDGDTTVDELIDAVTRATRLGRPHAEAQVLGVVKELSSDSLLMSGTA